MKIRNLMLALVAGLALTNCAEDVEKLAKPYLTRAQQSYENQQYALAKLQLDSIKLLYPKAFEARKQAGALIIEVELAEARTGKHYTDSLLSETQTKVTTLATVLYLDKDAKYQDSLHNPNNVNGGNIVYSLDRTLEARLHVPVRIVHGNQLYASACRVDRPEFLDQFAVHAPTSINTHWGKAASLSSCPIR